MEDNYYVYILTTLNNSIFYVGMTHNLYNRVKEHKFKLIECFTKKYNVTKLVYFEELGSKDEAYKRESQIKRWRREYKINIIERSNPNFIDLFESFI